MPRLLLLMAAALLLAACGGPGGYIGGSGAAKAPHPVFKIGAPYEVKGVWYTPVPDYGYEQTGPASWYGEAFQGQYTANGEVYDLNKLTAAHRTLPLPCIVEVTNLANGRTLRLRVNDRGPFAYNRIIDVSRRAAQLLGFERNGTAEVHVRILRDESIKVAEEVIRESGQNPAVLAEALSRPRPAPATMLARAEPRMSYPQTLAPLQQRRLFVEAGTYRHQRDALQASMAIAHWGGVAIVTISERGTPVYRVQLGPVASDREAERLRSRLVGGGYREARIIGN